jgi:mannose-6-phosphate isomerase-like protein (cupin superfamily)
MPQHIPAPTSIPVPGGKIIDEYVGRVNSGTEAVSVARMTAPGGWTEPAQTPSFDEVTLVLRGTVRVEHDGGALDVRAGEAVLTRAGERVRYSTPDPDGADYVAICVPAFSPDAAGREQ